MVIHFSLALILCASSLFAHETYILSYRAQIKNAVVIHESFHIASAMQDTHAQSADSLKISIEKEAIPLKTLLLRHKEEVFDFLRHKGLHTQSYEEVIASQSDSLIFITIPPTHVTVEFKNDYVIITRLIEE
jgi:CRISPR/Cas system-associated exonuclease Cas4 (RecB family)